MPSRLAICLSLASLFGVLARDAFAAERVDWVQFRGPGGAGVSAEKDLPTSWSTEENVAWKTALPGPGATSPV